MIFSQQCLCFSAPNQFLFTLHFSIWHMHFPINKHLILDFFSVSSTCSISESAAESSSTSHEWQSDQPTQRGHLMIHSGKAQDQGQKGRRETLNTTHLKIRAKGEVGGCLFICFACLFFPSPLMREKKSEFMGRRAQKYFKLGAKSP